MLHGRLAPREPPMKKAALGTIALLLFVLHQDFWLWDRASPLVFGFLPAGLAYHGAYTIAVALFLWCIVRFAWPGHLEDPR